MGEEEEEVVGTNGLYEAFSDFNTEPDLLNSSMLNTNGIN